MFLLEEKLTPALHSIGLGIARFYRGLAARYKAPPRIPIGRGKHSIGLESAM